MKKKQKPQEASQATLEPTWKYNKKSRPISSLSDEQLKKSFLACQFTILSLHNRQNSLDKKAEFMDEVAKQRGIKLVWPDTEFHKNEQKAKKIEKL